MKHKIMLTIVWLLLISIVYNIVMILISMTFEHRVVVIAAMLLLSFILWACARPCSDNDFDVMG